MDSPSDEINQDRKLQCIFCHAVIFFPSMPPKKLATHLQNNHDILFEIDRVVETTLQEQYPSLAKFSPVLAQASNKVEANLFTPTNNTKVPAGKFSSNARQYVKKEILEEVSEDEKSTAANGSKTPNAFKKRGKEDNASNGIGKHAPINVDDDIQIIDDNSRIVNKKENFMEAKQIMERFTEWKIGKCQYQCKVCDNVACFHDVKSFFGHIERIHNIGKKDYWDCYGDPIIEETDIGCGICSKRVRHDLYYMEKHFKKLHNLSLQEYYLNWVEDQEKKAIKREPKSNFDTLSYEKETNDGEECNSFAEPEVVVTTNDDTVTSIDDPMDPSNESFGIISGVQSLQTPNKIQLKWDFGVLYGCKLCTKQFFELAEFKKHISSAHNLDINTFINEYGDPLLANNFHECLVCGRGMLHCPSIIRNHLGIHKLTPPMYYEKFKTEINEEEIDLPITDPQLLSSLTAKTTYKSVQMSNVSSIKQWYNECNFTCKMCSPPSNFDSYNKVSKHLKKKHKTSLSDYSIQHGSVLTKIVWHSCQICYARIQWTADKLNKHIQFHEMKKVDYHTNYMSSYSEWPEPSEENQDDGVKELEWANKCKFQCFMCPKMESKQSRKYFYNYLSLANHLHSTHNVNVELYSERHGNPLKSKAVAYHVCQICTKKVLWNKEALYIHLSKRHTLSPDDYLSQFKQYCTSGASYRAKLSSKIRTPKIISSSPGSGGFYWSNKCTFQCKICFSLFKSRQSLHTHLKGNHNSTVGVHEEQFGEVMLEKSVIACQLCSSDMIWDSYYIALHLDQKHKERLTNYKRLYYDSFDKVDDSSLGDKETKWMDECEFGCRICNKIFTRQQKFLNHLKEDHEAMSVGKYKEQYKNYELSKKYHTCQVDKCNKEVMWELKSMTRHIERHNLTPDSYQKIYMKNYSTTEDSALIRYMNKCSFVCKICLNLFNCKSELTKHVTDEHHVGDFIREYQNVHGYSVAKTVYHTCTMCSENILWDAETLQKHTRERHQTNILDYIKENLTHYKENEECQAKHKENSEWLYKCVYECTECKTQYNRYDGIHSHVYSPVHKENIDKIALRKTVTKSIHTCQICGYEEEWDGKYLRHHFKHKHNILADIYFATYMSNYTKDLDEIKERQKVSKEWKKKHSPEKLEAEVFEKSDDDDDSMSEDVKKWASGCLYLCEICDSDHAGCNAFKSHLGKKHHTTFTNHIAKYQMRNVCIAKSYVFCKLCQKNVLHDIDDLKKHFDKEHQISISDYYERFKAKLKMPRTERPEAFKTPPSAKVKKISENASVQEGFNDIDDIEGSSIVAKKRPINGIITDVNQNQFIKKKLKLEIVDIIKKE